MSDLPRRTLGSTGLEVTTLGFGAMELRGAADGPGLSDAQAGALLGAVLDEGINFIDTSIDYGRSEELIGRFISHRRSEYVLASKCGCVPGAPLGGEHVHTAENIRAGIEQSLRLLATDHLDLVQFHRSLAREEFDAQGALSEALAMRDEGKVRHVGVSGILPTLDEQIEMGVFDAFQIPYSALQREHEDAIARASAAGAGIIVRGGVARGTPDDWENRSYYMIDNDTMRARWERGQARRAARRLDAHRVPAALHPLAPRSRHDDRRHQQRRAPAREHRDRRPRAASRRRAGRGQAAPRGLTARRAAGTGARGRRGPAPPRRASQPPRSPAGPAAGARYAQMNAGGGSPWSVTGTAAISSPSKSSRRTAYATRSRRSSPWRCQPRRTPSRT